MVLSGGLQTSYKGATRGDQRSLPFSCFLTASTSASTPSVFSHDLVFPSFLAFFPLPLIGMPCS